MKVLLIDKKKTFNHKVLVLTHTQLQNASSLKVPVQFSQHDNIICKKTQAGLLLNLSNDLVTPMNLKKVFLSPSDNIFTQSQKFTNSPVESTGRERLPNGVRVS